MMTSKKLKSCLKKFLFINGYLLIGSSFAFAHSILQPDLDLKKSIAALSSLSEGSKQMDHLHIFTGQALRCREDAFDFCDCCQDSGWGQDVHLAQCNKEEQQLGQAKEAKTVVYLGRYCHKKVLHHCVEHKRTYCVFGSRLAQIVETQGRLQQLHIGMGEAEWPNCRGLTPQEFQKIDFSKIDFSAIYGDIEKKETIEPQNQIQQRISQTVHQLYQEGKSHEG